MLIQTVPELCHPQWAELAELESLIMQNQTKRLTPSKILTSLESRKPKVLCKTPPCGSLIAELLADKSIKLTWRYTSGNNSFEELIGLYDDNADKSSISPSSLGYSVSAAMFAAQQMAVEHRESINSGGEPYHLLKHAKIAEIEKAKAAEIKKGDLTLALLLSIYAGILTLKNKKTGEDVRCLFRRIPTHMLQSRPCEVTTDEWQQLLYGIAVNSAVNADRLRSYLSAAHNLAIKAVTERRIDSKATGLIELAQFNLESNPLLYIAPHEHGNPVRQIGGLSTAEMITYWNCIKDIRGVEGATLRIHLLSGGVRPTQLTRLTAEWVKIVKDNGKFTLLETKGAGEPRYYTTPIRSYMVEDFAYLQMVNNKGDAYLFSTDGGITPVDRATPADWARKAVGDKISRFILSRIRSGVTDLMSASCVVLDTTCDSVQSHGLKNNVVNRHYRRDEKLEPKRRASGVLYKVVTGLMVISSQLNDDDLSPDYTYDMAI